MESQRQAFMPEILDHLDALEQELLNYETSVKHGASGAQLQAMFRSAHSLKSSLGMADFPVSSAVLHSMEHHLDEHRTTGEELEQDEVDLFLSALDTVRGNLESETEQDFIIEGKTRAVVPSAASPETQNASAGCWQIHKTVNASLSPDRFRKLPIFRTIDGIGSLVSIEPDPSRWNPDAGQITVTIVFSSEKTAEEIREEIFDPVLPCPPAPETVTARPAEPAPAESGESTPAELRILIVEDDFATRHLESSLLSTFGLCDVAVDGREALDAFRGALKREEPYDLVILDMLLPEIPGLEVLAGMRALEDDFGIAGLDRSSIAVVSTVSEHRNIRQSFSGQADAYIVKPVTRTKIRTELARLGILDGGRSSH